MPEEEGKCHFIGVGGIGMSGLAKLMLKKKIKVSGSDLAANPQTETLSRQGADIYLGHNSQKITSDMTVVYSSGIAKDNPEFLAAKALNCPILHRSDLLKALIQGNKLLAVAGMHGKTTVSSLLAATLKEAGLDPSFAVGGVVSQYGTNAEKGSGGFFVAEADESDGSFLKFDPYGAIVTNIGRDHMDYFQTKSNLIESFKSFLGKVASSQHLFWCGDNMYLQQINPPGVSYGFCEQCDLRALNFEQKGWSICFDIEFEERQYRNITLPLIGAHNALNALAVFGLALRLGLTEERIRAAFAGFKGVSRRCELVGEASGVHIVDDYAHHPTEIATTVHALREAAGERRLIVVYQPHRYSRVRDCAGSFAGLFDDADEVLVTEIYGAGETPQPGITHEIILEENDSLGTVAIRHVPFNGVIDDLLPRVKPNDLIVTLGAGSVTTLGKRLLKALKAKGPARS